MLVVYAIVETSQYGWGSARTLVVGALGLGLLAAFVARQARAANPLVPLRVFTSRTVSVANLVLALTVAGIFGMFFMGALYLQRVLRYDAIEVGLAFLPVAIGIAALALGLAARLIMRVGAKPTLIAGLTLVAAGLIVFRRAPVNADYVTDLLPAMVLLGLGAGLVFPSLTTLAMSAATPEDSGLASGLVNTTRQVGGVLGTAVLATLATARSDVLHAHGATEAVALAGGYRLAFTIAAVLVLAAIAVGLVLLPSARSLQTVRQPARTAPPGLEADELEPALLQEAA
jgi:predicted MFS family arabinose efflux permease